MGEVKMWAIKWPKRYGTPKFTHGWMCENKAKLKTDFKEYFGCNPGTGDEKEVNIVRVVVTEATP